MLSDPYIYVAGWYSRKDELAEYAKELEDIGYNVTSTWLYRDQENDNDGIETEEDRARFFQQYAADDLRDIDDADILVCFANLPGVLGGGGRHFELGYAYASGIPIYTIGDIEHVFFCLPEVTRCATWEDFLDKLQTHSA